MAIESQPPVLRRVQSPNELEMISTLKAIQSNFSQNQLPKHFGGDKILEDVVYRLDSIKTITSDIFDFLSSSIKSTEYRVRKLRSDIGGTHQKRLALDAPKSEPEKTVQQKQREEKEEKEESEETDRKSKRNSFSFNPQMPKELESTINSAVKGMLGPLNLIMDPIMSVLGKDYTDLVKPIDADVKKKEGGIYWLWKKVFGKKDKKKDDGFLSKIFGGFGAGLTGIASKVFPALMKALPIAGIAVSLIWSIIDSIKAVGKAKEWGVSKVSAGIAGFFAGSGSGGFKDAFKNAGKWALMGASVGMLAGGPVGALAGGLIGGAIGGILGFIGGETIAKGIQGVGDGVKKIWTEGDIFDKILGIPAFLIGKLNEGLATFWSTIPIMIASIFIKDEKKLDKFKKGSKDLFSDIFAIVNPLNLLKNRFESILNIKNIFKDDSLSKSDKVKEILKQVLLMPFQGLLKTNIVKKALNSDMGKKFTGMASGIFERTFSGAQNFVEAFKTNPVEAIIEAIKNIPEYLKDIKEIAEPFVDSMRLAIHNAFFEIEIAMSEFFRTNPIGKFLDRFIIQPIVGFFNTIFDFFSFVSGLGLTGAIEMVLKGNFAESLLSHSEKQQSNRDIMRTKEWEEFDHSQKNKDFTKWKKLSDDEKIKQFKEDAKSKNLSVDDFVANDKAKRGIQDAIITPQGRVIIPSSDDTIIATKSPVDKFKKDDVSQDLKLFQNQPSEKNNEIVKAINKLIEAVDKKPFNNIFSNSTVESTNFDKLRTVFA